MRKNNLTQTIFTAEAVTSRHPDKICDQISDAILDECLTQDPFARVAVETIGGHNTLVLVGEVTLAGRVDFAAVARKTYYALTGKDIGVLCNIVAQSSEISVGVNRGGAGDQGIMVGYACRENEAFIPHELYLCRKLLAPFAVDGKAQVTLENGAVRAVVLSVQGKTAAALKKHIRRFLQWEKTLHQKNKAILPHIYCNNTGCFETGGFDADTGVTGRKIVVDAYGPRVAVGGGAFSGKDPTKVDRSAAYMARWIALQEMGKSGAYEVLVKLAYVIGRAEPVMQMAVVDGREKKIRYDCRPAAIIERFNLRRPIYRQTAERGHFGFKDYPWERV